MSTKKGSGLPPLEKSWFSQRWSILAPDWKKYVYLLKKRKGSPWQKEGSLIKLALQAKLWGERIFHFSRATVWAFWFSGVAFNYTMEARPWWCRDVGSGVKTVRSSPMSGLAGAFALVSHHRQSIRWWFWPETESPSLID